MADSVDRVFVHALNTVKKIPKTGATRPPPADRMRLYGLYKQAMEGDVDGVMERPNSLSGLSPDELRREQDKWDAWDAQRGVGRTEAKRRYIETLIETMHTYATTMSALELVAELEFVWTQIKNNTSSGSHHKSPSSSGSYFKDTLLNTPDDHNQRRTHSMSQSRHSGGGGGGGGAPMKMLRPMSEEDEAERESRMRMIEEELQAAEERDQRKQRKGKTTSRRRGGGSGQGRRNEHDNSGDEAFDTAEGEDDEDDADGGGNGDGGDGGSGSGSSGHDEDALTTTSGNRWFKMMERAMVKLSAEVAALREQIAAGREFRARREHHPVAWLGWLAYVAAKHLGVDLLLLALVLLWMRRRKDRRLEDHVRGALHVLREYIGKALPAR